jgi:hypothetical protein
MSAAQSSKKHTATAEVWDGLRKLMKSAGVGEHIIMNCEMIFWRSAYAARRGG